MKETKIQRNKITNKIVLTQRNLSLFTLSTTAYDTLLDLYNFHTLYNTQPHTILVNYF